MYIIGLIVALLWFAGYESVWAQASYGNFTSFLLDNVVHCIVCSMFYVGFQTPSACGPALHRCLGPMQVTTSLALALSFSFSPQVWPRAVRRAALYVPSGA